MGRVAVRDSLPVLLRETFPAPPKATLPTTQAFGSPQLPVSSLPKMSSTNTHFKMALKRTETLIKDEEKPVLMPALKISGVFP